MIENYNHLPNKKIISAAIIKPKDKYCFKFQDGLCQKKDCRFIHKLMTTDQRKESGMDENLNKEKKLGKFKTIFIF